MDLELQTGSKKHDNFCFKVPFNLIIAGPTGCGKTNFIFNMLTRQNCIFSQSFDNIFYAYGIYQPLYDQMQQSVKDITFTQGLPCLTEYTNKTQIGQTSNTLIVLDDLMLENEKELASYFIRMRHAGISVVFVTQCLFFSSRYMRLISRNAHYFVLFKNPRDLQSVRCLGNQLLSGSSFLEKAYRHCTTSPYSYLVIDLKPCTASRRSIVTEIFDSDKTTYYVDGNMEYSERE